MSIKPLSDWPQQPLDNEQTMLLLALLQIDRDPSFDPAAVNSQMSELISKRADYHSIKMSIGAKMLVELWSEGSPGRAVQLLHACASHTRENEEVTVEIICTTIFPLGLPSPEDCSAAWASQKGEGGNLLDTTTWARKQ